MALTETQVMVDGVITEVDYFIEPGTEYVRSDWSQFAAIYEPGAVVAFREGTRGKFKILDLVGDPDNPTVFINKGKVVIEAPGADYGLSFNGCSNFRLLGSGDPDNYYYGIEIATTLGKTAAGVGCSSRTEKFEIANMEIHDVGFAGMLLKSDGEIGWTMNDVWVHDNYIHDTVGEGLYIGETTTPSHELKHVRVHNNLIVRTGWEGFQISNASEDVKVYNNTLYRLGIEDKLYQNKGFQTGDWTTGQFYNNIIMGATNNCLIALSSYDVSYTNNYIDGNGETTVGMCFTDNKSMSVQDSPILFDGNWFRDFPQWCFQVYNEVNHTTISNNLWDSNGQGAVFITYGGGADESNVTLSNNTETTVEAIQFVDVDNDDFRIVEGSYYADKELGYESEATPPIVTTSPAIDTFTVATIDESSIQLDFTYDNDGQDVGIKVERSLTGDNFTEIYSSALISTAITQYIDTELNSDTTYYYRIRTFLDIANGLYSSTLNDTTDAIVIPPSAPAAPSALTATPVVTTQMYLEWTDNSEDETSFVIESSFNIDSGYEVITTTDPNVTSYTVTGLTPNYYRFYRVKASNANGDSAYSNVVLGVTNPEETTKYTIQFSHGKNLVYKGDYKGRVGEVTVDAEDTIVNAKVISNREFISYHDSILDAQNVLILQKNQYPDKFVWFDAEPTELVQIDI